MAEFMDVRGKALLKIGTWSASTGEEVITDQDLEAIVAASQSGVLDNPVVKLGHTDPRNNFSDGEPAYGRVANLRIADGVLYGDLLGVPAALAEALNSAYPHVSVELARNVKLRNQAGEVAHAFDVVLTAAALLGATAPAVKGLSQKVYAFRESVGEDAFDYTTAISVAELNPQATLAAKKKPAEAAEAAEPAEKPAEEPAEPAEEPAEAPAAAPAEETAQDPAPQVKRDTADVPPRAEEIAEPAGEAETPTAPPTAAPSDSEGDPTMPTIDEQAAELRKKYDLAENASYKDLLAKVLEDQSAPEDVRPGSDETPAEEVAEQIAEETAERQKHNLSESAEEEQVSVTAPKPADPTVELDNVYVSRAAFAQFQAEHEAIKAQLAAKEAEAVKSRRDELTRSWFNEGLLHPTEVQTVRQALDQAEDTVVTLMSARAPLPVSERGHAKADELHFALGTDATKAEELYKADDALFGA